MITIFRWLW